jgi:hypothetical protein
MCDMSYALLVDRIERRALVDRQIAGTALAMGAADMELPEPEERLQRFDEWLVSPLEAGSKLSREQQALRKVLLGHA